MPRRQREVENLLLSLEAVLREASLWSASPPPAHALLSEAPFACDHLLFEQWLQFVFIPKMREWSQYARPLPHSMGLYPMGQQCLSQPVYHAKVLAVLQQIDRFFKE